MINVLRNMFNHTRVSIGKASEFYRHLVLAWARILKVFPPIAKIYLFGRFCMRARSSL